MKLSIGNRRKFIALLCLGFVVLSSTKIFANDPDVAIGPSIAYFPLVTLGSASGPLTFTVKNTHVSNTLNITTVSLQGTHADQFAINLDNCGSQNLAPDAECSIDVTYNPTAFGSKMARLEVNVTGPSTSTLVAFLSNDEGNQNQAERRLPPVAFSLNIPETMSASVSHNLQWSILGYHEDYDSVVAIFDCDGVPAGQCGLSFNDNIANSGLISADSTTPQPSWTFNGIQATEYHFSYAFQPDLFYSKAPGTYPVVVRFYRKNKMDSTLGEPSLSLMIPGKLSNNYYDDEGRRIEKSVTFP